MGDNSQILKLMRMINNSPKYWILSPDAVMTGSYDDPVSEFRQKVKNDDMDHDDVVDYS